MNRDSMKALRFDRRMLRRRGWITPEELEQQLTSLPDVADKVKAGEEESSAPAPDAPAGGGPESPTGF
jgi:hypothetical protein